MLVVIKGAGDIASGIALRLFHAGCEIAMTEIAAPLAVRRTVSFSQAVYDGETQVEDVRAVLATDSEALQQALARRHIAVLVDPAAIVEKLRSEFRSKLHPAVLVDAIMAKRNTGTALGDAPLVIGVGPGFSAGIDCRAVVETMRGHSLGRVITQGSALPNTGIPGEIGGYTAERLLRAGADGEFEALAEIGAAVKKGDTVALVRNAGTAVPVIAGIDGILRGILPSGIQVSAGVKAGDIDPRCERSHCFTVSDKALAVGGGVLEAIMRFSAEYS